MKTPPADVAAGLETNEPDLLCRSLSSRLAAPNCAEATSLGDGERENEHHVTLEQEAQRVKILRLAQPFELRRCSIVSSKPIVRKNRSF
jgi:hypothetical protein